MKQFEAILILLIMGAFAATLVVRQQRTGKARLGSWRIIDRASSRELFLVAQAGWISMALFSFCCAVWILARPYLQP